MLRKGKYREGYDQKLLGRVPVRSGKQPCIWFHAVSVGEVNMLRPLVERILQRSPQVILAISSTTRTGYTLAKKLYPNATVFYCPLDFSWAVQKTLKRLRPTMLVLAELELWPNLISLTKQHGIPVAVINGRLSDKSFRGYGRIRFLISRLLKRVDLLAVQDETTAERFHALGAAPKAVHVTGSLKYDGASTERNNRRTKRLLELAGIKQHDVVFLAGSTQAPEEAAALTAFKKLAKEFPKLFLIVVPRHPDRFEDVAKQIEATKIPWVRRSELSNTVAKPARILLVDTVGELGDWWGAAQIGFVGGSFGKRGGQNMIEPAAYGVATAFGPKTKNFRDIVRSLLANDAAVELQTLDALEPFVRRALEDPLWAENLGKHAQQFVATQLGATEKTMHLLGKITPEIKERPPSNARDQSNRPAA